MPALHFTIGPEQAGIRLSTLLRHHCHCSAHLIKQLKYLPNGILLDGQRVHLNQTAAAGQKLILNLLPDPPSSLRPRSGVIDLLYEDEHLLIVSKPAGQPVHPGPGHPDDSLGNVFTWYYQQKGEPHLFRPVNRLDRSTSGLMCVAKHAYAQERLKHQLHGDGSHRLYLACCDGLLSQDQGVVNQPIRRAEGSVLKREVHPDGAPAVTRFQVLALDHTAGRTLVALRLETGRTHQIRVHMASLHHPLTGDFLYGQEQPALIGRTALHSWHLSISHPVTGKTLSLTLPPPADFAALFPDFVLPSPQILTFGKEPP